MRKYFYLFFSYYLIYIKTQEPFYSNENRCDQYIKIFQNLTKNISIPPEMERVLRCSGSGLNDLGDYYGCKNLNNSVYYLLTINLGSNSAHIGICYFKECSLDSYLKEIKSLIGFLNKTMIKLPEMKITAIQPEIKLKKYKENYKIGLIIILLIFFIIIIINLFVTYNDIKSKTLGAFNLNSNAAKIFSRRDNNNTLAHLRVFDGLRFFCCYWVVFGHCCYFPMISGPRNSLELYYISKRYSFNFLTSAKYAVDVFFYMAGFLIYFSVQKYFNKEISKTKTILGGLLNRYLRLLPFVLIAIFLISFILPFMSDNSNYNAMSYYTENCRNYKVMFYNLLYVQNFVDYLQTGNGMCVPVSWYLACDMQFFVYSIFVIVIFNKNKFMRFLIFSSTFLLCSIYQIYSIYKNNYSFNDYVHKGYDSKKQFYQFYIRPFERISPYLLGIFFCELMLNTKMYRKDYLKKKNKNEIFLNNIRKFNNINEINSSKELYLIDNEDKDFDDKVDEIDMNNNWMYNLNDVLEKNRFYLVQIIFILSLFLINLTFWTSSISNKHQLNKFWSAMNNCFGKILFVFGIGCILHLTFLDKIKFIQKLFLFKIQTYVGRSTYGIYLIHPFLIIFLLFEYETYYYLKMMDLFLLSFGVFTLSWMLSFILGLFFESPFINLSKLMFSPEKKKKSKFEEKLLSMMIIQK